MANGGLSADQYEALVRKVAEKVLKMMRDQLRIDNERRAKRDRRRS